MPDIDAPGSPLAWVKRLEKALNARQGALALHNRYYTGDHPLPFVTKAHSTKMRDEFRGLLDDSRSNFMQLVVDAGEERLRVEGFRVSAATDPVADNDSWRIWQANQMDAESQTAFIEALVKGVSYLSVRAGDPFSTIAVEDPTQTIVGYEPGTNFRRRAAALRCGPTTGPGTAARTSTCRAASTSSSVRTTPATRRDRSARDRRGRSVPTSSSAMAWRRADHSAA